MPRVLVDSSAWMDYLRRRGRSAEKVLRLVAEDEVWLHPVVVGEVRLGGVDLEARLGLPMLPASSAEDVLVWVRQLPPTALHRVGWADCEIVHAAVSQAVPLLTSDDRQRALYEAHRR